MGEQNMSAGLLLLWSGLGLLSMLAYPFGKALVLRWLTKLFGFETISYWKCFFVALVGAGGFTLWSGILIQLIANDLTRMRLVSILSFMVIIPVFELLGFVFILNGSIAKSIGVATVAHYGSMFALFLVMFILVRLIT